MYLQCAELTTGLDSAIKKVLKGYDPIDSQQKELQCLQFKILGPSQGGLKIPLVDKRHS